MSISIVQIDSCFIWGVWVDSHASLDRRHVCLAPLKQFSSFDSRSPHTGDKTKTALYVLKIVV